MNKSIRAQGKIVSFLNKWTSINVVVEDTPEEIVLNVLNADGIDIFGIDFSNLEETASAWTWEGSVPIKYYGEEWYDWEVAGSITGVWRQATADEVLGALGIVPEMET